MSRFLADTGATERFAADFCRYLPMPAAGWTVLLAGELGAGKSTFARALIRQLGHTGTVPSPTYTLVEPYDVGGIRAYHLDLYRIGSATELHHLGYDELDDGLCLVEWPEKVPALTDSADLRLTFRYRGAGRTVSIDGLSDRGIRFAGQLLAASTAQPTV